jgi:hypothetical protein
MRRHFRFFDGTEKTATYRKGDMDALAQLTDAIAQQKWFPTVRDRKGGKSKNRVRYENPLVETWDTEK